MRRFRPTHYSLAFLTVALGISAVPAAVGAEDGTDPVVPADSDARPPQPAAPTATPPAESESAPPTTQTPQSPADDEPEATTPVVSDAPTTAETVPTTAETVPTPPRPEPAPQPVDETSTTPTTSSPTSEPAQAPVERPIAPAFVDEDELDTDVAAALPDVEVVRPIAFPTLGAVRYGNDWGNCRDGCARRHQGTDMIGVRMQPLLAAVDGTVTRIRYENVGTAGGAISITGADGWYYNYFHINNDTPGTDDGLADHEWQISPQLTVGSTVRAGQVIGYMGDSGNAEGSVPHLHFEIRQPDRTPVNPYHSLVAAQERETCEPSGGLTLTDPVELSPAAVAVVPIDGGGHWLIDLDGRLFAEGPAARTAPVMGIDCTVTPGPVETPVPVVTAESTTTPAPTPLTIAAPTQVTPSTWTVERGDSLWGIVQEAYGVSDTAATVSLVDLVFDNNRDVVSDPGVIQIGMTLRIPPRG